MQISISTTSLRSFSRFLKKHYVRITAIFLSIMSLASFMYYYTTGLGLAYNDARSHLDIARRVVEGLKPGLAQIGSVWLPLPHLLMVPTIWIDWMWHSGLSGALVSMIAYVATSIFIMRILLNLGAGRWGQIVGALTFATNLNVIYLQSTAMTELLLMCTMTAAAYTFVRWFQTDKIAYLIISALWAMLASLTRYDGWFLAGYMTLLVAVKAWRTYGWRAAEGLGILFATLAGFGIILWVGWNIAIFGDPFYFMSGPYSARAQQKVIEAAGMLATRGNWGFSLFTYSYDTLLSIGILQILLAAAGIILFLSNPDIKQQIKMAATTLLAPFVFNVIALYLGQSAIFIQGISADTWFNVRYGVLFLPCIAVFVGYLASYAKNYRLLIAVMLVMVTAVSYTSRDAIAIDDATVGSSQKNVTEVSQWLHDNAGREPGFVMISAASHDAILFSSGLPMRKFIHEGTGKYWENAGQAPDRWAKWLVMRTNDVSDQTFSLVQSSGQLYKYDLIAAYPFADIYQLKKEYWSDVETEPVIGKQK